MFKQIVLYSKQSFFITVLDVAFYFKKNFNLKNIIKLIRPVSEKKMKFVIAAMKKQKSHRSTYQFQNQDPSAKLKHCLVVYSPC